MNWQNLTDNQKKINIIKQKIDDIYKVVINLHNSDPMGLLGGSSGSLLFLYYYYKLTNNEKDFKFLYNRFDEIFRKFVRIGHGTYCNGYAGISWVVRFLSNAGLTQVDDIDDVLYDIDCYIHQSMLYEMQNNNFDFLHGSLGMAYYFATQNNTNGNAAILGFLKFLDKSKIENSDGSIKWLSTTYIRINEREDVYNLSLSHGMASIIALLTKLVRNHIYESCAKKLLYKTILFYKNNQNPATYVSSYSPWFIPGSNQYLESRLCWCYGDPGIALALYNAGEVLNDLELMDIALTTLIKSTKRKNIKLEKVSDACFCHGSSGLCHIYNRMYQKTGANDFKEAAIYWLDDTLSKGDNISVYAGYQFDNNEDINENVTLLTGIIGVGLTLLATIGSIEPNWDECVLLS